MYRYFRDPAFSAELQAAKKRLVNNAVLRMQQFTSEAVRTLISVCRDKDVPASSRVSAAREILNNAFKAVELEAIEERLKSLEERFL